MIFPFPVGMQFYCLSRIFQILEVKQGLFYKAGMVQADGTVGPFELTVSHSTIEKGCH